MGSSSYKFVLFQDSVQLLWVVWEIFKIFSSENRSHLTRSLVSSLINIWIQYARTAMVNSPFSLPRNSSVLVLWTCSVYRIIFVFYGKRQFTRFPPKINLFIILNSSLPEGPFWYFKVKLRFLINYLTNKRRTKWAEVLNSVNLNFV